MILILLAFSLLVGPFQNGKEISAAQKQEFIGLLKTLPTKGEFYTDEAVEKASPYLPILFALNEKDLEPYDIYPFAAISRGLCDREKDRKYAIAHFADIRHPELKLFWGAMLFDAGSPSSDVVSFLREALNKKEQAKILEDILGPKFEEFRARVLSGNGEAHKRLQPRPR